MDQKQESFSNGPREPKFKVGDQVIRKGELCTVRFVDHSMDPVSYMIQVNGTDRKIGTEESYLHPVESEESSPKDNSHVQEEIDHDTESLRQSNEPNVYESEDLESDSEEEQEYAFEPERRYSSSQSSEYEEEEQFCPSPRKRRRHNPFFVDPRLLQRNQSASEDVDYRYRHAEQPRQTRAHRRLHDPQPHYRRPAAEYVRRPVYAEPRRRRAPFGSRHGFYEPRRQAFFPTLFSF